MKQLFPRGKRIRPTDKDLVFHTALASLLPVFLLVVLLFHIRQIARTISCFAMVFREFPGMWMRTV